MNHFFKLLTLVITMSASAVYAQHENDIVYFLAAGPQDASKLTQAYLNPAIEGLSYGFNGGWYNSAKTHKTFGFDLGIAVHGVGIPSSYNYFDPRKLNLQTITGFTSTATNGLAPAISGPEVTTTYTVDNGTTFNGPKGVDFKKSIGINGVLAPTAQLSLGIYKNTDLKIRWLPEISSNSTTIKAFGVGVMHDIKQHIRGISILPFDLSLLVAYTHIEGTTSLENTFDKPTTDQRKQEMTYGMDGWLYQALISKKIAIVTFFGGVGVTTARTNANTRGSYVIPEVGTLKDPISLDFKNNSMRVAAGMRFNFGPVYLSGEYSLQEYSMVSVGLGVSFRESKIY
ncbi:MAG: hypothetical protein QM762_17515 [Chryseolinea sp.]